jgi:hypothetical protein
VGTSRSLALFLAVALLMPAAAEAQAPTAVPTRDPGRDSLAIGGSFTPALAGGLGFWPAVRISAPAGPRVGIDLNAGWMFPETNGYFTTRDCYAVQVRFLRGRRDATGSTRAWIVGAGYIRGSELDGEGQVTDAQAGIGTIKIGYGGDRIYANGMRAAGEIGVIGGGSSAPTGIYASLIVQWRPRH